jgi:pSer/pThr/pTyr-binding forkhead associated (FHA) protein
MAAASGHPDDDTAKIAKPPLAVQVQLRDIKSSRIFDATAARVRIGRSAECEIALPVGPDEGVSRVHCEFGIDGFGAVVLMDSGSTNGTLLNGHPVEAPLRVQVQQAIALGDSGPTLLIEKVGLVAKTG